MGCTLGRAGRPITYRFRDDFDPTATDWVDAGITTIGGAPNDPTRYLTEVSGRLTLGVVGAGYKIRAVGGLRELELGYRFSTGTSSVATAVGLVASRVPIGGGNIVDIGTHSVHVATSPSARGVNYYNGTLTASVDTDTFTLAADTDYVTRLVMDPVANTLTITDPDGGSEVLPTGWEQLWGDTFYIECLNSSLAHKLPSLNYVTAIGGETIELPSPNLIERAGNTLNLGGEFLVDAYEGRVLAAQLTGYGPHNTDEPIISFTYDTSAGDVDVEGDLDGFYFVVDVKVDYVKLAAGLFSWRAELVALPGKQATVIEEVRDGDDRANTHGVSGGVPVTALPGSAKVPTWDDEPDDSGFVAVEDGSVRLWAGGNYENSVTSMVDPYSAYEGAVQVEASYDGGARWFPVIGRQVNNVPGAVRLSNGRVRVTCTLSGGATLLSTEVWDPTTSAWQHTNFQVTDSGSPTTVATYTHRFISAPTGICVGPDGNLWFTGSGNDRIWRATPGGSLSTFPPSANVDYPYRICAGPDGALWFTSRDNNRIGRITTTGSLTTYTDANISGPTDICSDGTSLWFTSQDNDRIGKITTSGVITTYPDANLDAPIGICVGPDGLLWITSQDNDKIVKATTANPPVFTAYATGVGNAPAWICSGPDGLLWYTRTADDAICKITTTGTVTTYTTSDGVPDQPNSICSDGTDLWFTYVDGIGKITTAGVVTLKTHPNIANPQGIVKAPGGNLWFTSFDNNRVGVLNPGGTLGPVEFGGTLTILHDRPESAAIRLGAADGPELLDLTLHRGMNFIEGRLQSTVASTYGVFRTESEAGTDISTYGVKATAADSAGKKYTILSPDAVTLDHTGVSGVSLTGSATSFRFAISPENEDTLPGGATLVEAYFAALSHRQNIGSR